MADDKKKDDKKDEKDKDKDGEKEEEEEEADDQKVLSSELDDTELATQQYGEDVRNDESLLSGSLHFFSIQIVIYVYILLLYYMKGG
jgi:hypothetical protein